MSQKPVTERTNGELMIEHWNLTRVGEMTPEKEEKAREIEQVMGSRQWEVVNNCPDGNCNPTWTCHAKE